MKATINRLNEYYFNNIRIPLVTTMEPNQPDSNTYPFFKQDHQTIEIPYENCSRYEDLRSIRFERFQLDSIGNFVI